MSGANPIPPTLCAACRWVKPVVSGKGSRFLLCRKSLSDPAFAKYPPQPVVRCVGYEAVSGDDDRPAKS
ncbi:MAG: hypothetical protein QM811_31380 [Pirellulales bacterium]